MHGYEYYFGKVMDNKKHRRSKARRFRNWLRRKQKRSELCHPSEVSNVEEDEGDDYLDNVFVRSMETGPCNLSNELRIFVGTWNVAGRSPVGSLAVDLEDWLNLKDAADIYVLGFQEIVPLKTRTVIGAEDPSKATNWNLLIGKTLNNRYGCPWLTPVLNPISGDNYVQVPDSDTTTRFHNQTENLISQSRTQQSNLLMGGSSYVLLASKKMVGVFISVWIKKELLRKYCISNVKVSSVACGIMGYLGNKGSVSVSLAIEGTTFCFIAAHLASGEKKGDERRRNHQVMEIFKRTVFPQSPKDGDNPDHPLTIFGHDQIFWFGDLNYRLFLEDTFARLLIEKQDWEALKGFDQLRKEQEDGVFQGWKEGNIEFAPTYKYSSSNCNTYSGGPLRRSGEKQRTPAWCDRILWYGKGVKQLSYFRSEIKFSDHRPVSAHFSTQIELLKSTNPRVVALSKIVPTIPLLKQTGAEKADEEAEFAAVSLVVKDIEESPTEIQKL